MSKYLVGTEEQVIAANAQIESNCDIPNEGTQQWWVPEQAYQQDFWFIGMPRSDGWNGYTQVEMMQNVTAVIEMEAEQNWFPPSIPIPSGV